MWERLNKVSYAWHAASKAEITLQQNMMKYSRSIVSSAFLMAAGFATSFAQDAKPQATTNTPVASPVQKADTVQSPAPEAQAQPAPAPNEAVPAEPAAAVTEKPSAPKPVTPAGQILPTPDRSTPVGETLAGGLDSARAVSAIQGQEISKRDQLLSEINQRVQAADQKAAELKEKANTLTDEGKKVFEASWADYEKNRAKLQQSVEAAKTAEQGTLWERAKASLASDYAFYTASIANVELAAPN
jgi:hypothetical protein